MFEEILENDNSIFKNNEVFNADYFPEITQCRDKELKSILINIKPLVTNNKALNTMIIGKSSTGKTTVIKQALMEIELYTDLKTCYINCNIQNTLRKVYFQLFNVLYEIPPTANAGTEQIQWEVMKKLENESLVLVIDDINYLNKSDSNKLINELFRANEFYHVNMAIIIIVNNLLFKYSLEKNVQNVLQGQEIYFKEYTEEEVYHILKYRCKLGFKEGIITDKQIRKISKNTVYFFNIRKALTILNMLGQKIESENRDKITDEDLGEYLITN